MASQAPIFALALLMLATLVAGGCRPADARDATDAVAPASEHAADDSPAPLPEASAPWEDPGAATTAPAPHAPVPAPAPAPPAPGTAERSGPPLPELTVKSFGLHLPGGNDREERRAVLRALERAFPRYLDCYRTIETPGAEGTFGADLRVPTEGGRGTLVQARTRLPGDTFRKCMTRAFESVRFDPPVTGRPRMVSYSVKFSFAH